MSNRFLAILIAIIIGVGAIFWFTRDKANAPSTGNNSSSQATNHVMGNGKKNVTLVEYGDYQCPVCESYHATVKEVTTTFSNDIYFQFRNLPLSQIHQNAFAAARAAEAAAKQNKFWEMHDLLYEPSNWQSWTNTGSPKTYFDSYAQQLGLNVSQFDTDYASTEINSTINADIAEFQKTGQQMATPAFFIDGKFVNNQDLVDDNGPSVAKFTKVINDAIAAKNNAQ
jgi:protein-disulfide isomerase